jgi:hypothetical protein
MGRDAGTRGFEHCKDSAVESLDPRLPPHYLLPYTRLNSE